VPGSAGDLRVQLTQKFGWYSVSLTLGRSDEVTLTAALNPALPISVLTARALDVLQRYELLGLDDANRRRLSGVRVQNQPLPDFDVDVMPSRPTSSNRALTWDIVLGANFFAHYTDLHLNLRTLIDALISP
jgi:hypothetical protein